MLAGCLVNGILSVICIHVASVTTTPTRCRSDGKVENEEENHSHSFSGKIDFGLLLLYCIFSF